MHEFSQLIENLYRVDQQFRTQKVWSVESIQAFNKVVNDFMVEGTKKFGIPVPEAVGKDTANKYTLLLSHCTDLEFMETVINSTELKHPDLKKENIAIAYDNLLIKLGKKQKFGSALKIIEHQNGNLESVPLPIEDPENVNARRREFGLNTTLEEYINNASEVLKKIHR